MVKKQRIGEWTEQQFRARVETIVEEKIKDTKPHWVDKMMVLLDKAAGNYKKIDEEQTLLSGRQSEQSDAINELEVRVSAIEKHIHN